MTAVIPVKRRDATSLGEFVPGDQIPGQYVAGMAARNMLINCGVPINQRAFAGGELAAGVYGYDRWKAGTGDCNLTIDATTGVWTHTSGPVQQIVEAPEGAWGKPLTISVEDPSQSVSVSVGGATGTITAGSGRRGVTLTPTGSGNMTVQLTATNATYSRPQLERGGDATPFEHRLCALELMLCMRYYQQYSGLRQIQYIGAVGNAMSAPLAWAAPLRAAPAASLVFEATTNVRQDVSGLSGVTALGGSTFFIALEAGNTDAQFGIVADAEL